jgi:choline dehydrogenase-like flavoprotein
MGARDHARAVLDPELRVRGINGLRVLDASAMRGTIRGHTMGPLSYIAERGAALISQSVVHSKVTESNRQARRVTTYHLQSE